MTLADLPEGAAFTVGSVLLDSEVGKRLADMRCCAPAEGRVVRRSFFRGPLQVLIRGYSLLLRRCEAAGIAVESDYESLGAALPGGRGFGRGRGRGRGRGLGMGGRTGIAGRGRGSGGTCR